MAKFQALLEADYITIEITISNQNFIANIYSFKDKGQQANHSNKNTKEQNNCMICGYYKYSRAVYKKRAFKTYLIRNASPIVYSYARTGACRRGRVPPW